MLKKEPVTYGDLGAVHMYDHVRSHQLLPLHTVVAVHVTTGGKGHYIAFPELVKSLERALRYDPSRIVKQGAVKIKKYYSLHKTP